MKTTPKVSKPKLDLNETELNEFLSACTHRGMDLRTVIRVQRGAGNPVKDLQYRLSMRKKVIAASKKTLDIV